VPTFRGHSAECHFCRRVFSSSTLVRLLCGDALDGPRNPKTTLAVLGDMTIPFLTITLPPLRTLIPSVRDFVPSTMHAARASHARPTSNRRNAVDVKQIDVLQYALKNLLKGWINPPDRRAAEKVSNEPHCMRDLTPYYSLAQASFLVLGLDTTGRPSFLVHTSIRFRVLG